MPSFDQSRDAETELVPVRPRHLRPADDEGGCVRRTWFELRGRRGMWQSRRRFEVANRLSGDIALAHTDLHVATLSDFPAPVDLGPEAVAVHAAAAKAYTQIFAQRPARTDVFGSDYPSGNGATDRTSDFDEFGIRMLGPIGTPLRRSDGTPELLQVSLRHESVRVPDDIEILAARAARWTDDDRLVLVVVDLLAFDLVEIPIADPGLVAAGLARLCEVGKWALTAAASERTPAATPGRDCATCPYIPACDEVRAQ